MKFRANADMMASVVAHLLLLALVVVFSEVHQFGPVAADTMAVDIVTPQEIAEITPDPTPTPEPDLSSPDRPADQPPEPAAQAPAEPPQQQAVPPAPQPSPTTQRTAAAEPQPAPQQQSPQPPAYTPPEPDLSVKYHVMLGLPPDLSAQTAPAAPRSANEGGKDNFDAPATETANIGTSIVSEFRRHLKTCLKLPATLNSGDDVRVKLRVFMEPDGKLAAAPLLIEASASAKGPLLMRSAASALQACQPYAMLPRDRYGEWKVLDLDFTPRDFAS
ncbi:hypothetical protein [Bradyrhizobium lablabi]|uniref:hypothetical protein n=1 Tax=Bradyrhizobium lablabi TaxID=722472 RepID=UPI001BA561F5|nr:hypothetical protein [Bradyrhizobium lablabi]MBR0692826.1 hypothetical protein [Bradyrhizobium lablabi]